MTAVPIENAGAMGIVRDVKPHLLPPEAWSSGFNVRFKDMAVEKVLGHKYIYHGNTIAPRWALPWLEGTSRYWIYTDGTELYRTDGVIHDLVTRTSGGSYSAAADAKWSGGVLGGIPIVSHNGSSDVPQRWDSGTSRMVDLDNWPASTYAQVLRIFRQFVITYGITSGGSLDGHLVKWSHPAAPGNIPATYDPTDTARLAGEWPLVETDGVIIDALDLGGANFVYKSDSIVRMDFVPTGSVFSFRTFSHDGILAMNCVKEFEGGHALLTQNDFMVHNGASKPQGVLTLKNRKWLFSAISTEHKDKTFMVADYQNKDILVFFVPEGSSEVYPTEVFIWNWVNGACGHKEVPVIQFADAGQVDTSTLSDVIDDQEDFIDDADYIIDGAFDQAPDQVLMCRPDTREFLLNDIGNKHEELGDDQFVNGDFSVGTGWILGTGWSIGSGVASCDGTQVADTYIEQNLTGFVDGFYRVIYTVSNYVAGNVTANVTGFEGTNRNANGTYSDLIEVTGSLGTEPCGFVADSNFVGDIDNVEIRLVEKKDYTSYVERLETSITGVDRNGSPKVDQTTEKFCNTVHYAMESTGSVNVRVGRHKKVEGPVTWSTQTFDPTTQNKRNFRVRGQSLAFRIESDNMNSALWSFTSYTPDVKVVGKVVR